MDEITEKIVEILKIYRVEMFRVDTDLPAEKIILWAWPPIDDKIKAHIFTSVGILWSNNIEFREIPTADASQPAGFKAFDPRIGYDFEAVDNFIECMGLNYHKGNVVKYVCRAQNKTNEKAVEDLKTAVWYLNREIERLSGGPTLELNK